LAPPNLSGFFSRLKEGNAFQLKFKDRAGAGVALATALKFTIKRKKDRQGGGILVLGIPRGGIIVADVIARKLDAELDVVIARKLRAPTNKENAIGAVMPDGSTYLDDFMVRSLKVSKEYIEQEKSEQVNDIANRIALFRPESISRQYNIKGNTVILVDDGIATGSTVIAAARWIRKQEPEKLIIAAPVGQPQAIELLKLEADSVEVLSTPSNFGSVNQFYQNFDQATDERVIEILRNRNLLP
jgi:putative phosphoribosyl transferase